MKIVTPCNDLNVTDDLNTVTMQTDQSPGVEALVEQLEMETKKLTKMLYAGFDQGEEFRECELRIKRLQVEIISRKGNSIKLPKPFPIHGMIF